MSKLPHYNLCHRENFVNYESFSGNNSEKDALVMFYAPWCGHCKSAKPEFEKAFGGIAIDYDEFIKNDNPKTHEGKLLFIKVNGDEHPDLLSKMDVAGFPTFKYIKNIKDESLTGEVHDYNGARNSDGFEEYSNKKLKGEEHFSNYETFEDYRLDYDPDVDKTMFN